MPVPLTNPWARFLARTYALVAAALFPTSLISGVWLYLSLGSPADPAVPSRVPAVVAVVVDVLLFGLFALHHSLLARTHAKTWLKRLIPSSLERSTYVLIASLLFLLVAFAWQPVPGLVYRVDGWPAWLLRGLQVAGIGLTLLAAKVLDPLELAGLRDASTDTGVSIDTSASADNPLTATGAYGLVRHPIYLGWVLMVWPTPVMTGGRLTFAAISTAYLVIAIPWEERSLVERFGRHYRDYCSKVRWRMLPGLY